MKWRYGIIKYKYDFDNNKRYYGIGELYYENDPLKPFACSEKPVEPYIDVEEGDNENPSEAMERVLTMMMNDIKKYPAFDIDGPYEKEPYYGEDWVDFETGEPFAGHIDDYGIKMYLESMQEDDGDF